MNNICYCSNCANNQQVLYIDEGLHLIRRRMIFCNGFIDFPNNYPYFPQCPYCGNNVYVLSLTTEEWKILKQISTDVSFILEMDKLKQTNIVDFNLKLSQFKANASVQQQPTFSPQPQSIVPRCPTCGSTNIKKISGTKRWVGTGIFGLASSDLGKVMECLNCHAKW